MTLHLVVQFLDWTCMLRNSIFCALGDLGSRGGDRMCPSAVLASVIPPRVDPSKLQTRWSSYLPVFFISSPHCCLSAALLSGANDHWSFFSVVRGIFWFPFRVICDLGKNWVPEKGYPLNRISYAVLLALGRLTGEVFLGCLVCTLIGVELYLSGFLLM